MKWRQTTCCKIPKTSPGAYIFQRPFLRGLSTEGNLRFKIRWVSLIVASKLTYRFCFVLLCIWGQLFKYKPQGRLYRKGDLTEGFLCYRIRGLIFGGAYFQNFTVFKDELNTNRDIAYSSNTQRPYLKFTLGTHMCIAPFSLLPPSPPPPPPKRASTDFFNLDNKGTWYTVCNVRVSVLSRLWEENATDTFFIACVASVSVRFRSKERGTRVKDRAKNGAFLAGSKPKVAFLGLALLRNQTETLATQATFFTDTEIQRSNCWSKKPRKLSETCLIGGQNASIW